jgi:predicted DNA-binding transcriptional regulator YafY
VIVTADISYAWQLSLWLLGWYDDIEELEPKELRQEIIESIERCNQQYL